MREMHGSKWCKTYARIGLETGTTTALAVPYYCLPYTCVTRARPGPMFSTLVAQEAQHLHTFLHTLSGVILRGKTLVEGTCSLRQRTCHASMSAYPSAERIRLCYLLHSEEEQDSGNIKDKASKLAYLDKIVALVGICSGDSIDVRPSKVVAGLEPECTNKLLTVSATVCHSEPRVGREHAYMPKPRIRTRLYVSHKIVC